eukprot:797210-Rhodomonas_salina.3
MPEPEAVGDEPGFRPENRMLPRCDQIIMLNMSSVLRSELGRSLWCSPVMEVETFSISQRSGDQSLPLFNNEEIENETWESEEPYEDPEGFSILPDSFSKIEGKDLTPPDALLGTCIGCDVTLSAMRYLGLTKRVLPGIEWKRPEDMGLTEPPKFKVMMHDPELPMPENPPPVIAKQARKFGKVLQTDFYCRASSNPLGKEDAMIYHTVCAMNIARQILGETGQDLWDCIYPKNEKGQAMYNPSGKYVVKLHVMGSWRAVEVDDRMPDCNARYAPSASAYAHGMRCKKLQISSPNLARAPCTAGTNLPASALAPVVDGACILPRTKDKAELWPIIMTKALYKAISLPAPPPAEGDEEAEPEGRRGRRESPRECFRNSTHVTSCAAPTRLRHVRYRPRVCLVLTLRSRTDLGSAYAPATECPLLAYCYLLAMCGTDCGRLCWYQVAVCHVHDWVAPGAAACARRPVGKLLRPISYALPVICPTRSL